MIKPIEIDQISGNFRGYLWYSDAVFPKLIWDETVTRTTLSKHPFVVEGQLFDAARQVSVRIAHIDGAYRIAQMELKGITNWQAQMQHYYASTKFAAFSRQQGDSYRLQLQYYTHHADVESPLQPGFSIRQPQWTAFVGFSEKLQKMRSHE